MWRPKVARTGQRRTGAVGTFPEFGRHAARRAGPKGLPVGARLDLLLRFGQRLVDAGVEDTGQRAYRRGVPGSPMDAGSTARIVRGTRLSWRHLSSRLPLLSEADDLIPDKGQLR